MAYHVRTPDGELTYASLYDIDRAYAQGLIDPEDEVREEGSEVWRKVNTIPALRETRPASRGAKQAGAAWILLAVVLGALALYQVLAGRWLIGLLLAMAVSALLTGLTRKAFRLKRTATGRE